MGVKGWRGIIRILQSLVGDQVNFIVTQEKSSDHFLRLQQPFILKTLSFQNNWQGKSKASAHSSQIRKTTNTTRVYPGGFQRKADNIQTLLIISVMPKTTVTNLKRF